MFLLLSMHMHAIETIFAELQVGAEKFSDLPKFDQTSHFFFC